MGYNQAEENRPQNKGLPPANSLACIRSKYPTLAASEARVAIWVLQQPEEIMRLSIAQVAQACRVSDTTVLRFCRNTGFQGYTDLKLSLARDLISPTQVIHDDIIATGNTQSPIFEYAEVTLPAVACEACAEAIASRLVQATVIDTLGVIMALNNIGTTVQNEKDIWDPLLPKML